MTTLRTYREDRGLTMTEVANQSGLSVSYLSLVERGMRSPSVSALQQIAAALGVSLDHAALLHENSLTNEEARAAA